MVLHRGDEDFVSGAKAASPVALGDEVDAFGRAAHKDDFAAVRCANEAANLVAGCFVGGGRAFAQLVHAAMDVGAFLDVAALNALQNRVRFLRGGSIVEIHERMPVDLLCQSGKVLAHALYIEILGHGRNRLGRNLWGSFVTLAVRGLPSGGSLPGLAWAVAGRHHGSTPALARPSIRLVTTASSSTRKDSWVMPLRPSTMKARMSSCCASFSPMPRERK
jgi:hypothetical protein